MNPTYQSHGVSQIPSHQGTAHADITPKRRLARLAATAAVVLACATCGRNNSMVSAQPAAPVAAQPAPVAGQPAPAPVAGQPVLAAAIDESHIKLASKFVEAAEQILHNGLPGSHQWAQGATLLDAACSLDPAEPSYPRLLAETWRQLGDNDQVIAALNRYRAAAMAAAKREGNPQWEDQVVEVELIDRYLSMMQTVDKRIQYLRDVLGNPQFAPEVKAHAAVLCVPLLAQRSDAEAEGMITQAVRLDPLNIEARRMQYQMISRLGSPLERLQVLLAMVLSNPTQRDVLEEVARQLGEAGLPQQAMDWYYRLLLIHLRAGTQPKLETVLDFAAQAYAAGHYADADRMVKQVIDASQRDPNAWFMRLAFDRTNPDQQVVYTQELELAKRVLLTQSTNVAKKILGPVHIPGAGGATETPSTANAATQPAIDPTADVNIDSAGIGSGELKTLITRINQGQSPPGMADLFVSATSDLAWFHLYFENAPLEAAPWVMILKAVVPRDDIRAVRLQGWLDLTEGRYDQAHAELSSIQDIDPLAMIGIIRMTAQGLIPGRQAPAAPAPVTRPTAGSASQPAAPTTQELAEARNHEAADALARRLMGRYRVGLAAAMVRAAYRDRNLEPVERPDADAIRAELKKFPAEWLEIIDKPNHFYHVIGAPLRMPHKLGEPMLAKVTLSNASHFYAITVGPEGVVSPDLFFDTWLGVRATASFPHAAYDRIANVLVLPPGTSSTQIVRLDQGAINSALREKPSSDVTMYARVTTNPIARGAEIGPGPAGIREDFQKQFVRDNSAMNDNGQEKKVIAGLSGLPSERIATLDTLEAHVLAARTSNASGRALDLAPRLEREIEKARNDAVPDVAAWATYVAMQLAQPADKPKLVATLTGSHDWEVRLLGGVAALDLPPNDRKPIAMQLSHDTLPAISMFGACTLQDVDQPTSRPAMDPTSPRKPGAENPPATAPSDPALPLGPELGPATQP